MRIVITGIGCISAIGQNVEETYRSLITERSGIKDGLGRVDTEDNGGMCRSAQMGIKAAREALVSAQLDQRNGRLALLNGTTVGGMDISERYYAEWRNGENLNQLSQHEAGACTHMIAEAIGGVERMSTISTACSSALNTIILGARMIECGMTDYALAGGTECLTAFHRKGFESLQIVDKAPCRPMDASRQGLNLGEGAAYVVMESEESARKRGAEVWAYLSGYGNHADAYHQTSSSPEGDGAYMAMSDALAMSGLKGEDVDYINLHGTATENNDQSESRAIRRLFGETVPMVSSTKAMTGHTTSASGAIEAVISILALRHQIVPGNLRFETAFEGGLVPEKHTHAARVRNVMCNAFGFGGNDSAILLSQGPEYKEKTAWQMREIVELSHVGTEEEVDYKQYISPLEARRLTGGMREMLAKAYEALKRAGVSMPDAIITATRWGCIHYTRLILDEIMAGEEVKPSYFMQSTHNTVSSLVSIRLGARGYNATYSHGRESADGAMMDAQMLLSEGKAKTVLVMAFDEADDVWDEWCEEEKECWAGVFA